MHDDDVLSGVTYQVWRLSDLKLLRTAYLDVGENRYAQISPEEARLGPDGSVFVQTLACGIERITGVDQAESTSKLVYTFPGNWCGVPTIVGHFLVQSVPAVHGFIVLDIANAAKPREASRLALSESYSPHWTAWDPKTERLVATSGETPEDRTYLLKLTRRQVCSASMRPFATRTGCRASASPSASGHTAGRVWAIRTARYSRAEIGFPFALKVSAWAR